MINKNSQTLYVTTASTYKTQTLNETITFVTKNFENRKKSERDIWLFGLDITEEWDDMFTTRKMLEVFLISFPLFYINMYVISDSMNFFKAFLWI